MLSFIGLGDLHLDKMAKIFPEDHHILVVKEVQKAINYARDNNIRTIIQYGDVSEKSFLSKESRCVLYRLFKENEDIEWYFILGNHDWGEDGVHSLDEHSLLCELGCFPNVHIVTKRCVIVLNDIPIHFMPYPHKKVKSGHVNIAHVDINGFKSDSGRKIESDNVFPDDELLLTGHLHTPQSKDPWYCVGTLYQTNFGETEEKGWHHVEVKKSKSGRLVWDVTLVKNEPEFLLRNVVIEKKSDFKLLQKNDKILYKLFISKDVEVPETLLSDYPNVLKTVGYSTKTELKQVMEEMLVIEQSEALQYNVTEYLGEFLASKGATDKQIKRALELSGVDNALRN